MQFPKEVKYRFWEFCDIMHVQYHDQSLTGATSKDKLPWPEIRL